MGTDPTTLNTISETLGAACLLAIEPLTVLFELWDRLARETVDMADDSVEEEGIVETDYLSPEHLGQEADATRYVNFFDDELVRLLYSHEACVRLHLQTHQVVQGLLARNAWGLRHLAYAIELDSKEMCTEALAGSLAFYQPLDLLSSASVSADDDDQHENEETAFETEWDVYTKRTQLITATLRTKEISKETLDHLITLHSLTVLWHLMPPSSFSQLWQNLATTLHRLAPTSDQEPSIVPNAQTHGDPSPDEQKRLDGEWHALIGTVCRQRPTDLPYLRLLRDYGEHGLSIARIMFG